MTARGAPVVENLHALASAVAIAAERASKPAEPVR
jgi:hypothetical protein